MGIGVSEAVLLGMVCCVTLVVPLLAIGAVVLYNRRRSAAGGDGSREGPQP